MPQFEPAQYDDNPEAFMDSMTMREIQLYRDSCFDAEFIRGNPSIFLDNRWIKVDNLRAWLLSRANAINHDKIGRTRLDPTTVNCNPSLPPISIKHEAIETEIAPLTRSSQAYNDTIEILDSDEENKSDLRSGSNINLKSDASDSSFFEASTFNSEACTLPFDPDEFTELSTTTWEDSNLTSYAIEQPFNVTKEVRVERLEYLTEIPSLWPIPKSPTAFILDLRDPRYELLDKEGALYRVDTLLKNKDQDSWTSSTGTSDSRTMVVFQPGHAAISCRRSRCSCRGCYACSEIDPKLLQVERYELNPDSRATVLAAQQETRSNEEMGSKEQKAATFLSIIKSSPCRAKDENGKVCNGRPKMQPKPNGPSRGHHYYIACSGWKKTFKEGHRVLSIPDNVDEDVLALLMSNKTLSSDCDTAPCSRVVSSHIGLKLKVCPHMHIVNGKTGTRSPIVHHTCPAKRRIYIPDDPQMRFGLIIHPGNIPHNHPMPPMSKASLEVKVAYVDCINAAGTSGLTVQKIDKASSTKLILKGKSPGEYNTALGNNRIKRELLRMTKIQKNPAGLGLSGVYHLFHEDFKNDEGARYIHDIVTTKSGKILVITGVPYLLSLIHQVPSFECDTTFKRVKDSGINEWEMVIYYPPVQRALTIARIYLDCADTDHYEHLYDNLQRVILAVTKKPMHFKLFHADGNLFCMNADMEAAQILGASKSIKKSIDFAFSGISVDITPQDLAAFFVRLCLTHTKRGILDFKSLVSVPDFNRLMNFPYLESVQELQEFSAFVKSLKVKKIQDWWNHKYESKWIIPCIVKSQSRIPFEHLDHLAGTTNAGEGQHHWTNYQTGIGLSLVDAVLTAREVDERVAQEVRRTLETGVKTNSQTDLVHRMSRQSQRQSAAARKAQHAEDEQDLALQLKLQLAAEKENQQQASARAKELQAQLKELKVPRQKKLQLAKVTTSPESSSSGRVKSITKVSSVVSSTPAEVHTTPDDVAFDNLFPPTITHPVNNSIAFSELDDALALNVSPAISYPPHNTVAFDDFDFQEQSLINAATFFDPFDPGYWLGYQSGPFYDVNYLQGLNTFDHNATEEGPLWSDSNAGLHLNSDFTRIESSDPNSLSPDPISSSPPPPMSSSPPPSTPSSPLLVSQANVHFAQASLVPFSIQTSGDIMYSKGKKRAREVDEDLILPVGSRRTITKPSREPLLVASLSRTC